LKVQSTVVGACPIGRHFVVFLQGVNEMVRMIDVGVLDGWPEVVKILSRFVRAFLMSAAALVLIALVRMALLS
jgi:hypothetical protein